MSEKTGNIVRRIAIILFGLAVTFTLLGGLGTTCVAFNAQSYGKAFEKFIGYKGEYQAMVYASIVTALVGIAAIYGLVKGKGWGYPLALLVLIVGLAEAGLQMYYTSTLKQVSFFKTPPTSMRFYTTLFTLIVFLVLRLPGIWEKAGFGQNQGSASAAGMAGGTAACVMGVLTITTPLWAGASHMLDGYNLVFVLEAPLLFGGAAMILAGACSMLWARRESSQEQATLVLTEERQGV